MESLTKKQQAIYDFIVVRKTEGLPPPTQRELGEAFTITNMGALGHLLLIEKKGYIELIDGSRGIKITGGTWKKIQLL